MAEALFKATFVTVFIVGIISLIKGEFQGWGMTAAWFVGTLVGNLLYNRYRRSKSAV